jgi:hypothetical protein
MGDLIPFLVTTVLISDDTLCKTLQPASNQLQGLFQGSERRLCFVPPSLRVSRSTNNIESNGNRDMVTTSYGHKLPAVACTVVSQLAVIMAAKELGPAGKVPRSTSCFASHFDGHNVPLDGIASVFLPDGLPGGFHRGRFVRLQA